MQQEGAMQIWKVEKCAIEYVKFLKWLNNDFETVFFDQEVFGLV